jgi:hypothetical protein
LVIIDEFIVDCTKEKEPEVLIFQLQEDLHSIHHEVVDCTSPRQTEIFLAVLYHLGPLLPPNSVVSWFDILLRPALREPKLSNQAVTHAKELIITALQKRSEIYTDKVGNFRRRLIELYLLDAFNDGSCDDLLEWAELNVEERQKRTFWKYNLEDILVKFGNERPEVRIISPLGYLFLTFGLGLPQRTKRPFCQALITTPTIFSFKYFHHCTLFPFGRQNSPQTSSYAKFGVLIILGLLINGVYDRHISYR